MTSPGGEPRPMFERMKRAAMLDVDTYEEVEADTTATGQAACVVALVAVAQGIGAAGNGVPGVVGGMVIALLSWLIWSGVTYLVGDKLLGGTATWGELLRTLGVAQSPGALGIFAILPVVGGLFRFAIPIWILVTGIIAIRQALDFSTGKAVLTAIIGWMALVIPTAVLAGVLATQVAR
jgi:hypothetical protein